MQFGFVVPFLGARRFVDLAMLGESSGWDAIFTWETVFGVEAWTTLAAAAERTERIRLGTLLTPVSRIKPWDLASKVLTVDELSDGRAILSVGLGALHAGWTAYEADEGRRVRAQKLDECLAVYAGLMAGQPFSYSGEHYSVQPNGVMLPGLPVRRPWPPVWVVGAKIPGRTRQRSLERAARWDGLLPSLPAADGDESSPVTPEALAALCAEVRGLREAAGLPWAGYEVVLEADSSGEFTITDPLDPAVWQQAGATWWVESWWSLHDDEAGQAELRRRIAAGPPAAG